MKKTFCILLLFCMIFTLSSCNTTESKKTNDPDIQTNDPASQSFWYPTSAKATFPDGSQHDIITCSVQDNKLNYRYSFMNNNEEFVYETIFSSADGVIGELTNNVSRGDKTSSKVTTLIYDADNCCIESQQDGKSINKTTYTFDDQGRILTCTQEDKSSNTVYTYAYGENDYTIKVDFNLMTYSQDTEAVYCIAHTTYTIPYDLNTITEDTVYEALIKPFTVSDENGNDMEVASRHRTYSSDGYMTEDKFTFKDGTSMDNNSFGWDSPTFDENGKLVSNVKYSSSDTQESSSTLSYDENGNLTLFTLTTKDGTTKVDIKWEKASDNVLNAIEKYCGINDYMLCELIEDGVPDTSYSSFNLKIYQKDQLFPQK